MKTIPVAYVSRKIIPQLEKGQEFYVDDDKVAVRVIGVDPSKRFALCGIMNGAKLPEVPKNIRFTGKLLDYKEKPIKPIVLTHKDEL